MRGIRRCTQIEPSRVALRWQPVSWHNFGGTFGFQVGANAVDRLGGSPDAFRKRRPPEFLLHDPVIAGGFDSAGQPRVTRWQQSPPVRNRQDLAACGSNRSIGRPGEMCFCHTATSCLMGGNVGDATGGFKVHVRVTAVSVASVNCCGYKNRAS